MRSDWLPDLVSVVVRLGSRELHVAPQLSVNGFIDNDIIPTRLGNDSLSQLQEGFWVGRLI